jgi:hypothetical protein
MMNCRWGTHMAFLLTLFEWINFDKRFHSKFSLSTFQKSCLATEWQFCHGEWEWTIGCDLVLEIFASIVCATITTEIVLRHKVTIRYWSFQRDLWHWMYLTRCHLFILISESNFPSHSQFLCRCHYWQGQRRWRTTAENRMMSSESTKTNESVWIKENIPNKGTWQKRVSAHNQIVSETRHPGTRIQNSEPPVRPLKSNWAMRDDRPLTCDFVLQRAIGPCRPPVQLQKPNVSGETLWLPQPSTMTIVTSHQLWSLECHATGMHMEKSQWQVMSFERVNDHLSDSTVRHNPTLVEWSVRYVAQFCHGKFWEFCVVEWVSSLIFGIPSECGWKDRGNVQSILSGDQTNIQSLEHHRDQYIAPKVTLISIGVTNPSRIVKVVRQERAACFTPDIINTAL